jgi:NAD(P)H-dependent flavin oxidoreductase YrpB (nitropropane dioxygenase family)
MPADSTDGVTSALAEVAGRRFVMAKDPLHTKLCDMLEIEFPIVAFTHCKDVAAAVINAGAFAVYGGAPRSPEELEADIKWIRDRVSSKPFGIDLLFPASAPPTATPEEMYAQLPEEHLRFVEDIKRRHNIPEPKNYPGVWKLGWMNQENARRQLDVVLEHRVPILCAGLGNPAFVMEVARSRGMLVWGLVGRPRQARRAVENGWDVIVATGTDAAGHTGEIGTFSIVPAVAAIAGDIPVLAAGGVTTGRHLAAALSLGAAGVWTGTIWQASRESDDEMAFKERLVQATAEDTVLSRCTSGFTMRTLKSLWHEEWERPDAPRPLPAPFQMILSGPVQQAAADHKIEGFGGGAAGQGVGFVTSMKPSRQIVFDMVDEARAAFEELTAESPASVG